jgi:GntR family transcriptional regulator, transcriptional repressor for pyruvate dehydrogenase complex
MAATGSSRTRPARARGDASVQIALEIRRHLARTGARPGDRIGTEQSLASEFGVSRPTLREALRLLSSSHLIRASRGPGGGIFVASTPNEGMSQSLSDSIAMMLETQTVSLGELVEARIHLEVPLAGLAAANATAETLLKLDAAIVDQEGHRPTSEQFRLADACFHRTIAAAAGNDLLRAFTSWTLDVLQPSLVETIGDAFDAETILSQHRDILRAIRRGQPRAAERAMRAHLEHLLGLVRAFENCPDNQ